MKNKFKVVIYFETDEPGDCKDLDGLLAGSWLWDQDFRGAVTSAKITRRKKR